MMATLIGPDLMIEPQTAAGLDATQPSPFVVPSVVGGLASPLAPLPTPQAAPQANPPPNPPFVFPVRPSSMSLPGSAPFSLLQTADPRPASFLGPKNSAVGRVVDLGRRGARSPALPAFSFNPGASLPSSTSPSLALTSESTFLSPPQSPATPASVQSVVNRPTGHGHRRGGSEFVGGKLRNGDSITVTSSSPTKSESGLASPALAPADFRPRRGHAHRRSAAISSHDLSSIMMPLPGQALRGNSAPNSPAGLEPRDQCDFPSPGVERPTRSEPSLTPTLLSSQSASPVRQPPKADERQQQQQLRRPPVRNRVGFSDTLEFIPRPLSVISTDTSSTVTARPGCHSVSNSISSVMSASNADRDLPSPVSYDLTRIISESWTSTTEDRPSTAGAILERTPTSQDIETEADTSSRRRGSTPDLGVLPPPDLSAAAAPAIPSPGKTNKRWSLFGLDPFVVVPSPTWSRPSSSGSAESPSKAPSPRSSAEHRSRAVPQLDSAIEMVEEQDQDKPCSVRKKTKKPKKVKTWAGSILSRRSKTRKAKRRTATPPPVHYPAEECDGDEDESGPEMAFEPESVPTLLVTESTVSGGTEHFGVPRLVNPDEEDASHSMIDLDAALGPFNTPLPRNPEWEAAQKAGGHVKRQLHSAAGMSRFTGPGMHYQHRRTESAPEMVPFDSSRFGFTRFASSSTMADVFEEEEEGEEDEGVSKQTSAQPTPLIGTPLLQPRCASDDRSMNISDLDGADSLDGAMQYQVLAENDLAERKGNDVCDSKASQDSVQNTCDRQAPATASTIGNASDSLIIKAVFTNTFELDEIRLPTPTYERASTEAPSPRQIAGVQEFAAAKVSPSCLLPTSPPPVSPCSSGSMSSGLLDSPRSPVSSDTQRLSSAPAAAAEDSFHSLLLGEPGPEVRLSVDIPSLTSSASTMTRESNWTHHHRQARPPSATATQPRPASFSVTAFGRRRSSLASLSRLISSSHGERSKLSVEMTVDEPKQQSAETKVSKTKRLSRMMQFWKPKDSIERQRPHACVD